MLSDSIIRKIKEGKVKIILMNSAERRQADRDELSRRRKEWLLMSGLSEIVTDSYAMRGERPSPKVCWIDKSDAMEEVGREILNASKKLRFEKCRIVKFN